MSPTIVRVQEEELPQLIIVSANIESINSEGFRTMDIHVFLANSLDEMHLEIDRWREGLKAEGWKVNPALIKAVRREVFAPLFDKTRPRRSSQ